MGRERRRKGAVNRLRRFFYGLMLLVAMPIAAVSNALAGTAQRAQAPQPPTEQVAMDGMLLLRAGPEGSPLASLESASVRGRESANALPRIVSRHRQGDFDITVPGMGLMRLQLHTERDPALSAWSLGGALEASLPNGRVIAADVPVLRINDMFGGETRQLAFDASVEADPAGTHRIAFRWRI